MNKVQVLTLRGINENPRNNMLSNFTKEFPSIDYGVGEFPAWTSQFMSGNQTYEEVRKSAANSLAHMIHVSSSSKFILAGYSGGAHAIGDMLNMISFADRLKIKAVVLCSDPAMPEPLAIHPVGSTVMGTVRPGAYGIAGPRGVKLTSRSFVHWVSDYNDPICSLPYGSPLRDLSEFLITTSPDWMKTNRLRAERMRAGLVKPAIRSPGSIMEAFHDFGRYAFGGNHVRPYPAMLSALGKTLAQEMRPR